MGCGCGKVTAPKVTKYTYVAPDGTKISGLSEVEARAKKIRNGGGTVRAE